MPDATTPLKVHVLTCLACGQGNRVPAARIDAHPLCGTCGADLIPDHPVSVDGATLAAAVRRDSLPLIVDFWAPWCGPCRMMTPEFHKAAAALQGRARLLKLNTEEDPKAGAAHDVRSIPTLVKFAGGREVKRQPGATRAEAIVAWAGV